MRSLAHLLARLTVSACLGTAALVIAAAVAAAATEQRVALVIGNGAYRNTPALPNPVADAQAMAASLERVGFEVILREDLNKRAMEEALRDFGRRAAEADVALVYYAGHGLQVAEENYLLPVEAALQRERDLLYEALPLDIVLGEVAQARSLGLVILDACRNNPLADRLADRLGIRADRIGSGLARIDDVPTDTLVAFATRPTAVAEDGSEGNSPYTRALLEHLATPNLELSLFFRRVRDTVLTATDGRQEPFTYGSLGAEPFYFNRVEPNREPVVADASPLEVLDSAGPTPLAIAAPTDPDGDPLTVAVTGLPRGGEVRVGGRAVRVGDWLTVEQLAAAGYSPDRSLTGDAGAFEFRVEDDRGGTALGRVRVAVLPSNRAPVVEAERALTAVANPLGLREPSDPDGDPLTITVVEVPSRGAVRSGERAVGPGDELTPADLTALRYDPEADFAGDAGTFVVAVEDGRGERVTSTVRIDVVAPGEEGEAPVVAEAVPAAGDARPDETAHRAEEEGPAAPQRQDETQQRRIAAAPAAVAPDPTAAPAAPPPAEAAAPPTEPETYAAVAMVDANVRERPTTSSDRVARIRKGDPVRVTGGRVAGNWYPIETGDGVAGFIYSDLIEVREASGGVASPSATTPAELPAAVAPAGSPPPPPPQQQQQQQQQQVAALAVPQDRAIGGAFRDCEDCPALVRLPASTFVMGSGRGDPSERPPRRVSLSRAFAIGKHEVTTAEWNACVEAGGCRYNPDIPGLTDASPVRNVSWMDAQDYVSWLSATTGRRYRLPTEAEWEYAARGGTATSYWWGDDVGEGNADCADCGGPWDREAPAAVGSFRPNPFGLGEMNGGVAEWVADCWFASHEGAPGDGSAREGPAGSCTKRVLRGGSWRNDRSYLTSASRLSYDANVRYYTNGFRVARDLN